MARNPNDEIRNRKEQLKTYYMSCSLWIIE